MVQAPVYAPFLSDAGCYHFQRSLFFFYPTKNLQAQLLENVKVQGQNAQFIKQDEPFLS